MTRTTPARPVDIEALFPALSAHRRTATRLHPRPGRPSVGESSVGGPLLWPAGEPWPMCEDSHPRSGRLRVADIRRTRQLLAEAWARTPPPGGRPGPTDAERAELAALDRSRGADLPPDRPSPMLALAQLYRRDVPGLVGPPEADLLQVFWCPFDHPAADQRRSVRLHWRRAAEVADVLAAPPQPAVVGDEGCLPEPCVLHPEQVTEYQYIDLLPRELRAAVDAWDERCEEEDEHAPRYQYDLSLAPGWKVGGFASWHLTDPIAVDCACGASMAPLLTVDSSEWHGQGGSWRPLEDRAAAAPHDADTPTRVEFGRWGELRIFTCSKDPAHPHRLSLQ
jgi:hypothetical protein